MASTAEIAILVKAKDEASKVIQGIGGTIKAHAADFKKVGLALTGATAAIGGGALMAAIDFETAFGGVRKTIDATEEEFGELEAGIRGMT